MRKRYVVHAANVLLAAVVLAWCGPAAAQLNQRPSQVQIDARFAYVGAEFSAGLGVDWGGVTGLYDSTGQQAPEDASAASTFGSFNFGGTAWFSTGLDGAAPGGSSRIGRIDIGAGLGVSPFFGSARTPIEIQRHNNVGVDDVTLRQSINVATDLKLVGRIPIRFSSTPTAAGGITVNIEPEIGLSLVRTTTTLHSDQFFVNGTDEARQKSETTAGFFWGLGVSTLISTIQVPVLGDLPLLGRAFYRSRQVGGSEVALRSISGFTEFGRTRGYTNHQVGAELIVFITPRIGRPLEE